MKATSLVAFVFVSLALSLPVFAQERVIRNTIDGYPNDAWGYAEDIAPYVTARFFFSLNDPIGGEISHIEFSMRVRANGQTLTTIDPSWFSLTNCWLSPSFDEWSGNSYYPNPTGVPSTGMLSPMGTDWASGVNPSGIWRVPFNLQGHGFILNPNQVMGISPIFSYTGPGDLQISISRSLPGTPTAPHDGMGDSQDLGIEWYTTDTLWLLPPGDARYAAIVTVIPAPGAVALIGCAGFMNLRRRR